MAKKTPLETDMARLQKKVSEKRTAIESAGDAALRSLQKRLKRAQRKRRRLAARKRHAMGKKAAGQKSETAST
jgi:hypothetical protein